MAVEQSIAGDDELIELRSGSDSAEIHVKAGEAAKCNGADAQIADAISGSEHAGGSDAHAAGQTAIAAKCA